MLFVSFVLHFLFPGFGLTARDAEFDNLQHLDQTILRHNRRHKALFWLSLSIYDLFDWPYLLIEHVGVFGEPDTQAVEGSDDHGVQVSGVERSGAAALVHDVAAHRADRALAIRRLHAHLHLSGK